MERVVDGKRYSTDAAELIASDRYWDGSNFERSGRTTYLYKTAKGAFFTHTTTMWLGERESIEVVDAVEAAILYEGFPEQEMGYAEAFGVEPVEA